MNNNWKDRATKLLLFAVVPIIVFFYLLRPVEDPDFFWHLKTGEWIVQQKSVPSEDPFTYTTPQTHSSWEHFVLKAYWLSQVLYYLFYLAGGIGGIVFLRFIISAVLIYSVVKLREGDALVYAGLIIVYLTVFFKGYPVERPQVFSFIFFALLLKLLEDAKQDAFLSKSLNINIKLSLLMLLWANMHGGYLLGQAVIIVFIGMEGVKYMHPSLRPIKKEAFIKLAETCGMGIAFSFLNPNTYHAASEMMGMSTFWMSFITDYQSSVEIFRAFHYDYMILYWFILGLAIIGLAANIRKTNFTYAVLLILLGYFSFTQIRYVPFFIIAALPAIGKCYSEGKLFKFVRVVILAVSLTAGVFYAWEERFNINNLMSGVWIDSSGLPVDAANFIIENNIQGNMYNDYNWGGYLIWRLAPEKKVFIDGRGLYPEIYRQAVLIDNAYSEEISGVPVWKYILETYSVKYVVTPFLTPNGDKSQLTTALLKDKDWVPVFFRLNSIIFVKDTYENQRLIERYKKNCFHGR